MKVHRGAAQFICVQGKRYVTVYVTFSEERWHYEVIRPGPSSAPPASAYGIEKTWAAAYRRAMRAAERMLGRKHD